MPSIEFLFYSQVGVSILLLVYIGTLRAKIQRMEEPPLFNLSQEYSIEKIALEEIKNMK